MAWWRSASSSEKGGDGRGARRGTNGPRRARGQCARGRRATSRTETETHTHASCAHFRRGWRHRSGRAPQRRRSASARPPAPPRATAPAAGSPGARRMECRERVHTRAQMRRERLHRAFLRSISCAASCSVAVGATVTCGRRTRRAMRLQRRAAKGMQVKHAPAPASLRTTSLLMASPTVRASTLRTSDWKAVLSRCAGEGCR